MNHFDIQGYWNSRYAEGRDSGEGSRGENARAKARFVNELIREHGVHSMVDWGCGDGQVLEHITGDVAYVGVDVSGVVLNKIQTRNPDRFFVLHERTSEATHWLEADLALSMDVIFHLVNDKDYHDYLLSLFGSARKIVAIYSTDYPGGRTARHVLRRQFTPDVAQRFTNWELFQQAPDPEQPGFYLYRRMDG